MSGSSADLGNLRIDRRKLLVATIGAAAGGGVGVFRFAA
jgi:hypothetical protein